jgi:ribose 5-phosphate isomerase B
MSLKQKTIAFAADHAGVSLKAALLAYAQELGHATLDLGTQGEASVDYPDFANALAQALGQGQAQQGVLICGSGIGISMAANRHAHVRAALCTHGLMARLARAHNDANVLALGARLTGVDVARECLYSFLTTNFEGGRHARRVDKLSSPPQSTPIV